MPAVSATPRQHAVLIVIDTLRDDAVTAARTPVLDGLAARGQRVERAWSAGTWTVPSVVSMLTGMSVREHGWDLPVARIGKYPALPDAPRLPEVLKAAGFVTEGLYANPYLAEDLGFDRGFDRWTRVTDKTAAAQVERAVARWDDGQRHFLYVHVLGPHSPLRPSEAARARWEVAPSWFDERMGLEIGVAKRNRREGAREAYRDGYHAVVEDTDALVGQIVAGLGPYAADAALVVTSDHGELLGEHGVAGHGAWVWEGLTHVPLIAVGTPVLPDPVSTSAVADLVTRAVGVPARWSASLDAPTPVVAQRVGPVALPVDGPLKGIWKDGADLLAELDAARAAWEASTPAGSSVLDPASAVALHPDTLAELRALGYVADDAVTP